MTAQVGIGMIQPNRHGLSFRVIYCEELWKTHGASESWETGKETLWGWMRYRYSEGGFFLPYYKVIVSAY